jgi:hypothetical protein
MEVVMKELLLRGPGRSRRPIDLAATVAFVVGGLLIIWSSYIHFHLWDETDGYRSIKTIGPLFLLQSIAGFLISVSHGLFGFKDSWSAPFAHQAFAIEIAIIVVLGIAGVLCLARSAPTLTTGSTPTGLST